MPINLHQIKHYLRHFFTAKRNGHGIHSPFAYQLCEEVFYNKLSFYDFIPLSTVRNGLLTNTESVEVEDYGAGSKTFKSNTRKIKDIAKQGISSQKQSELIYKLMNFLHGTTAIELGTSLGLNTLYMARVNKNGTVISLEGSKSLSDFASQLALKNKVNNIRFIHARFEEAFPQLLQEINKLDVLYVDGNHTYEATLKYFKQALEKKHKHSAFIFDDIYWSKGMTKAWEEIKKNESVSLSIDTFYFGIVFFKEELKEKVDLKLYV